MTKLSREEIINRALAGRKQSFIVRLMNDSLPKDRKIDEPAFSRKKKGYQAFTEEELAILSKILGQDITN